ncbi:MAG TPA: prepilin peptidase [Gemmatimonadales bacterium]|nr:prepilin peptidase [Gemmatimonadales bacterium]
MADELVGLGPLVVIFAALFGAMFGSFLNVCILRLPADQSVVRPPSRCPSCGKGVAWYDNVPVLSWLALRGRCRHCGAPISMQYPLVELATAALWALAFWRLGPTLEALRAAVFGTILLGIAMTDAREYIIPDEFTWGGLAIGLLFSLAGGLAGLGHAVLGAAVGFGLLWAFGALGTWMLKQDAMGGGDVKMMAMVGAFLGWQGVPVTVFLGALIGSLIYAPLALFGRKRLVPFGVFLALGAAATYVAGPAIYAWYMGALWGPA